MTDNIQFSAHPEADLKKFLQANPHSKTAVLTDENTDKYCYPLIREALPAHEKIVVPGGEEYKNLDTCVRIWF